MPKPAWPPPRSGALPAYLGAAMCAFVSLLALFVGDAALPAFYSFLPMGFLFVGFPLHALLRRVEELEQRVVELSGRDTQESSAGDAAGSAAGTHGPASS